MIKSFIFYKGSKEKLTKVVHISHFGTAVKELWGQIGCGAIEVGDVNVLSDSRMSIVAVLESVVFIMLLSSALGIS